MDNYVSKAIPTIIKFSSRASIKLKDSFYTIEYGEERQITDYNNTDIDKERQLLIETCNQKTDEQIQELVQTFLQKN